MHLLYIGVNYAPEQTSVGPFAAGICEHLVESGHRVSVITAFPYYPQWRIQEGYQGSLYRREIINEVNVRRVIHFVPSTPRSLLQRLLHDLTFSFNALLATSLVGPVDGIFCSSPPPFTPSVSWLAGHLRGVDFAINLTDLAADASFSLGIIPGRSRLARWACALENVNYEQAAGISVLCAGFKDKLVRLGVPAEKITVIPTWADTETIRPLPRENAFRAENGLGDLFVALHAGNMGLKQGLQVVIEASRISEEAARATRWVLVGDGEERTRLQELADHYALTSLFLLPLQSAEAFPYTLSAADVLLLTQRANVTDAVIPSKLLNYMASGRPVVASVNPDSESARRITDAQCGVLVPPEDPAALADAVQTLRRNPDEARRLGSNGRAYVEQGFAKSAVLKQYDRFLSTVFHANGIQGENTALNSTTD